MKQKKKANYDRTLYESSKTSWFGDVKTALKKYIFFFSPLCIPKTILNDYQKNIKKKNSANCDLHVGDITRFCICFDLITSLW